VHSFVRHNMLEPTKLVGSVTHILAALIDQALRAHRLVANRVEAG
jgi:hypothetical protein